MHAIANDHDIANDFILLMRLLLILLIIFFLIIFFLLIMLILLLLFLMLLLLLMLIINIAISVATVLSTASADIRPLWQRTVHIYICIYMCLVNRSWDIYKFIASYQFEKQKGLLELLEKKKSNIFEHEFMSWEKMLKFIIVVEILLN